MEEKIKELKKELTDIVAHYLIYQKHDNIEKIKEKIPKIQEFVLWFFEENRYEIEDELYQTMKENLLNILRDILTALEQNDKVLMHDAVAYGLLEYLNLFVETEEECEL